MENSNQVNPAQPVEPTPTTQPTPVVVPPAEPEGSNKMVLWLLLGLVAIVLVVGGIYLYLSQQQGAETTVTQPTPTPVAEENLENELNAIDVAESDQDFTAIDQDLQSF